MDIVSRCKKTIEEHHLLSGAGGILIALSGGPDSLVLLHILKNLQPWHGLPLEAFHLDHGLRRGSGEEARKVVTMAKTLGVLCHSYQENVETIWRREGGSLQEVARNIRLKYLQSIGEKRQLNRLALGHHADDQVETMLMNLIRGGGLKGLSGIPYKGEGGVIHPLLDIWRQDIEAYCEARHLEPIFDPSNREPKYRRNSIRLELIPFLEQYNPRVREAVWRAAKFIQEDHIFLEEMAEEYRSRMVKSCGKQWSFHLQAMQSLPGPLQKRIFLCVWKEAAPHQSLASYHLEEVLHLLQHGQRGKGIDLPGQLRLEKGYQTLKLFSVPPDKLSYTYTLPVPGEVCVPALGVEIKAQFSEASGYGSPPHTVMVDGDRIQVPLQVRNRRPGDRFHPLGGPGKKKLKDFFIDSRIDRDRRDTIPLVVDASQEIIWVAGYRISHNFRIRENTQQKLLLQIRHMSS